MKVLYLILGIICLGAGSIGIVLPILPTTPFFLVSAFCFAKSSEKLSKWFSSTSLYKNHLESFAEKRALPRKTKITIMASVTGVLTLAFVLMDGILVGQIILFFVWIFHMIYFLFRVKDLPKE